MANLTIFSITVIIQNMNEEFVDNEDSQENSEDIVEKNETNDELIQDIVDNSVNDIVEEDEEDEKKSTGFCIECKYCELQKNTCFIPYEKSFLCFCPENMKIDYISGVLYPVECHEKNNFGECLFFEKIEKEEDDDDSDVNNEENIEPDNSEDIENSFDKSELDTNDNLEEVGEVE